tara:strand:+ start:2592 stop:2768 length:177 start_codon:yes stop_codon:yes gene_type:complete
VKKPMTGGRFSRDPKTGALKQVQKPTAQYSPTPERKVNPAPVDPETISQETSEPKKGA